jgi:hypothetical protein
VTPQEIMNGMAEKNRQLTMKNDEYRNLTETHAGAKRDYAVALAKKLTSLKMDGKPVTLIPALAKGDPLVADFRYKRDIAEGVMKACRESMADLRGALDSYRSLLTWLRAEKEHS